MKVIVAGSRDFEDEGMVFAILDELNEAKGIDEIIEGGCRGADKLGQAWARLRRVTCTEIKAEWHLYGKQAGPIRNARMAQIGDLLVAFYEDKCGAGTRNMVNRALDYGLDIMVARRRGKDGSIEGQEAGPEKGEEETP